MQRANNIRLQEKAALWLVAPLLFALFAASCSGIPIDRAMSAEAGGDASVIFCGPDAKCHQHYVYVQLRATASPTDLIRLHVPGVNCSRVECVRWQIIDPSGSFGAGGGIKRGQTEADITIGQVIGSSSPIGAGADNEWRIKVDVYYNDSAGAEHLVTQHGLIRIEVLDAAYVPIGCNDPNVAWEAPLDGAGKCKGQWTTQLRTALCGACDG